MQIFIGRQKQIEEFQQRFNEIFPYPRIVDDGYPYVCFVTGSKGSGKSMLAKKMLEPKGGIRKWIRPKTFIVELAACRRTGQRLVNLSYEPKIHAT